MGIQDVHHAAVGAQVDQAQNALCFVDGQLKTAQSIGAATGGGNGEGQAVFGGVVDDGADPPDAAVVVSNSEKSVCQTRLRAVGGSRNTRGASPPRTCGLPETPGATAFRGAVARAATEELVT